MSQQRLKVLNRFLERPSEELSGADLMRLTNLASGSLYPIVYVLEENGLLESRWEVEDPRSLGRPRKRLYKLTALGERVTEAANLELLGRIPLPAAREQ
jgi:DNA-binding PadR family transcriptional regulator